MPHCALWVRQKFAGKTLRDERFLRQLEDARLLQLKGMQGKAQARLARALRRRPGHPEVLAVQGRIFETQGLYAEALAVFRTALERAGEGFVPPHELTEPFVASVATSAARCCILLRLDAPTHDQRKMWTERALDWLALIPPAECQYLEEARADPLLGRLLAKHAPLLRARWALPVTFEVGP